MFNIMTHGIFYHVLIIEIYGKTAFKNIFVNHLIFS